MTTSDVYEVIKAWINNILNTELEKDITIIRGEQNAPAPSDHYIILHQPLTVRKVGSGNFDVSTDDEGNQNYEMHYEGTLSVEEYGGIDNGDNLRILLDSLRRTDILNYFRASKVSILRNAGIQPIPQLLENNWELRSNMDLIILFPDEVTYQPGYFDTVEAPVGTFNH